MAFTSNPATARVPTTSQYVVPQLMMSIRHLTTDVELKCKIITMNNTHTLLPVGVRLVSGVGPRLKWSVKGDKFVDKKESSNAARLRS